MRYADGDGAKFRVDDKVVPNHRAPMWLMKDLRKNRKRTVVGVIQDQGRQCLMYMLGHKAGCNDNIGGYAFRSYQLEMAVPRPPGRPRTRRTYHATASIIPGAAPRSGPQQIVRPMAM